MSKAKLISEILEVSERTIFRWKNENKLITVLLDKYFTDKDLEEFLNTRKINRFECFKEFSYIMNNQIKEFEMKFIFSIGNYELNFIDMLLNRNAYYHSYKIDNVLKSQQFHFELNNDLNYFKFINYLFDTNFDYFYNNMTRILQHYPQPIVKEFFSELNLRLKYE